MINQERIKNLLLEFVQIDSHSRKEREIAERIKKYCEEMGAQVEIDDAGEKVGGNSGNVIARFPGTITERRADHDERAHGHGRSRRRRQANRRRRHHSHRRHDGARRRR